MGGISLGTDLFMGVGLSVAEAASLGLPFEVLKTYMGGNRGTRTWDAMQHIYRNKGLGGFWNGLYPKMMEATLKGPVLIISKDRSQDFLVAYTKLGTVSAGYIAGFIGGVTQTVVMAPMTFLVTKAVSSSTPQSSSIFKLYQEHGLRGIYTGSSPIAMRQATNWSLRQGFNDFFRLQIVKWRGGPIESGPLKLSKTEEVIAGILSGTCACINQPFEVARIEQQWRQAQSKGKERLSMSKTLSLIYRERGIRGWYAALTPRIALSIWQTLFMVTIARSVRMHMQQAETKVPPRV